MKTIIIMILVSILLVIAQVSLKNSLIVFKNGFEIKALISLILNINFIIAIISIMITASLWMYILSYEKISIVYPFISLSYIFMMIYAHYYLNELITLSKVIGMFFIAIGLFIIYQ